MEEKPSLRCAASRAGALAPFRETAHFSSGDPVLYVVDVDAMWVDRLLIEGLGSSPAPVQPAVAGLPVYSEGEWRPTELEPSTGRWVVYAKTPASQGKLVLRGQTIQVALQRKVEGAFRLIVEGFSMSVAFATQWIAKQAEVRGGTAF